MKWGSAGRVRFAAIFLALFFSLAGTKASDLALTQTILLPGVRGRIDHFAYDARRERLFVCALGNNTVEVIDTRSGKRVRSISGLGRPQGAAYIPKLDRLFVANDQAGLVRIYDGVSFQSLAEIN